MSSLAEKLTGEGDADLTFFTVPEIANIFEVTAETVRKWIASGDLKAMKFGNRMRVSKSDLVAFSKDKYVTRGEDTTDAE